MKNIQCKALAILVMIPLLTSTCFAQYYPTDVIQTQQNDVFEVQKTYVLPSDVLPTAEMKEKFVLEGYEYSLMDMLKQDMSQFSTQDVVDKVELSTKTNKLEDILPLLPATKEHTTEDGYMGELSLDVASISIEIAGYSSGSKTLTEHRTYPNLSSADMALIPQTVTSGGTTYNFATVDWQTSNDIGVDGHAIANRYTAVASYTAVQKYSYVSGYTVTADYTGTLSKISQDTVQYTAIFRGVEYVPEIETPLDVDNNQALDQYFGVENEIGGTEEDEVSEKENRGFHWLYLVLPLVLFVFPIVAYLSITAIQNKSNGRNGTF